MERALKPLRARNLAAAVGLAKQYRDLNQPEEAESICRDILDVTPEDEEALRTLGLALTDQFPALWATLFDQACAIFKRLPSEYKRVYYTGIAWERFAKAQVLRGNAANAIHAFEAAIEKFEAADRLGSADDPAPILHYNRCVRALTTDPLLVAQASQPPALSYELGD
jgi:tetratricopeptide (TPR) repeat protein